MSKSILVIGATGTQGGATVKALIASGTDIEVLAVTRNPISTGAQKLAQSSSRIKLVQGDLNDLETLFKNARLATSHPIWGVFSVQSNAASNSNNPTTLQVQAQTSKEDDLPLNAEEQQGIGLIDMALRENVSHFVYTSVDRHGEKSFGNPSPVPHFISKHNIEHYLVKATTSSSMTYTILRPVAFMDNALGTFGKMFGTLWNTCPSDMKLQLVAASDIGHFAAQAFTNSEADIYKNNALSLAGSELTFKEANEIFKEVAGRDFPKTFGILGRILLWTVYDLKMMFKWFVDEGYAADIEFLRKLHPGLTDFGTWVKEESGFVKN